MGHGAVIEQFRARRSGGLLVPAASVVTVLLALTYLAGVLVFSVLTGVVTGIDSAVGVAASTLLVVGLFHPIRRRTQAAVGRRLYRTPYDRGRIVTAFSRQVGQETDITVVTGR